MSLKSPRSESSKSWTSQTQMLLLHSCCILPQMTPGWSDAAKLQDVGCWDKAVRLSSKLEQVLLHRCCSEGCRLLFLHKHISLKKKAPQGTVCMLLILMADVTFAHACRAIVECCPAEAAAIAFARSTVVERLKLRCQWKAHALPWSL